MKKLFFITATLLVLASCNEEKTMDTTAEKTDGAMTQEQKEERNKQAILRSIRGLETGNADSAFINTDKDYVELGDGTTPPVKNLDSAKAGLQAWLSALDGYKSSDLITVADGDYVMVYGTWTGRWKNDFMGMKATGKSFKINDVDIFKFNDAGKIIEHRYIIPNSIVSEQLGMGAPPTVEKKD